MFSFKNDKKYKVTDDNYFDIATMENFMSVHPFINYMGTEVITPCEARVMDQLENPIEPNSSMLIGSYVDSYYDGTLDKFKKEHPELFKKDGTLLATYKICDDMIDKLESDELIKTYMTGKKQQIFTGEKWGINWKIKTDNIMYSGDKPIAIVDLKTCKDLRAKYNGVNFIYAWGYDYQLALYREIFYQNTGLSLPCYIAAISRETLETAVIYIPPEKLDTCMETMERCANGFLDLITNKREPERCERCDFCNQTRENKKVLHLDEL